MERSFVRFESAVGALHLLLSKAIAVILLFQISVVAPGSFLCLFYVSSGFVALLDYFSPFSEIDYDAANLLIASMKQGFEPTFLDFFLVYFSFQT